MSLVPALFEVPRTGLDWSRWSFNNKTAIDEIRQAILAQKSVNLPQYVLDPINFNAFYNWLTVNQQAHNDFNGVLHLQGDDLESVDIRDERQLEAWIYLNYQEIYSARAALNI